MTNQILCVNGNNNYENNLCTENNFSQTYNIEEIETYIVIKL
jgi:hypothetical protein